MGFSLKKACSDAGNALGGGAKDIGEAVAKPARKAGKKLKKAGAKKAKAVKKAAKKAQKKFNAASKKAAKAAKALPKKAGKAISNTAKKAGKAFSKAGKSSPAASVSTQRIIAAAKKAGGRFSKWVKDHIGTCPHTTVNKRTPPPPSRETKTSSHGGNSKVTVDREKHTIEIESFLEYSGPDATDAYAKNAKKQIEKAWSGKHTIDGVEYTVVVKVTTSVNATGKPTPGYDPIIVDSKTARANQRMYGAGPGHQNPKDADETRLVVAHEYGHSLGVNDEYHDTETGSVPNDPTKKNNLMAQTWPDDKGVMPHPYPNQYDAILKNYGF
jgi:hypothetical protein